MYFSVNFYLSNQLFPQAAFIQQLTFRTIIDLRNILLQFFVVLFAFGCIIYIALQREERLVKDDQHVMKNIFPYFMIDAIWSQYMMALGELGDVPDAFDTHPWKF